MNESDLTAGIKRQVTAWAKAVAADIGATGIYLFGSLVYRDGAQFGPGSDVDLVVLFSRKPGDALARRDWLEKLLAYKQRLEVELAEVLRPANPAKPLCSVVVATPSEVASDIHKDGTRAFFSENLFLNLLDGTTAKGLRGAGSRQNIDRLAGECLRFVQKKRNEFLAVNATGEGGITPYNGCDPAPKDVMRYAAMAAHPLDAMADPGTEYDTQLGLDFLSNCLYDMRDRDTGYRNLQHWLSVRRGARGTVGPLPPRDYMLFAEIICDAARARFKEATKAQEPPRLDVHNTVWFAERFGQAFPGVRGVTWFENPETIKVRLETLLKPPLVHANGAPAWWWRGEGNCPIERFTSLGDSLYLMDSEELLIRRIAAVHSGSYYRDFVYVEAAAMPPTGLYKHTEQRIAEESGSDGIFGYYWEEYGLVDGVHQITRGELDDGAAVIDGQLQDVRGRTELRVRYVTPYNFVIAAHGSPINSNAFDQPLDNMLKAMRRGEDRIEELARAVLCLPKRH